VIETVPATFPALRVRVDAALDTFLSACRDETVADDPRATMPIDEVRRLVAAGGKRLRPAFCYWGFRAAGGPDGEPIVRASAALELLHTMALIHDDLMDDAAERRGVLASAHHLAAEAVRLGLGVEPTAFGRSAAILAGDLAAVLADRMLLGSGFASDRLAGALVHYHRMRMEMAEGQFLDVAGLAEDPVSARRAAVLKGGVYTVEGPLLIGAALAAAAEEAQRALARFGAPLGEAFQLRDDLHDREGAHGATPGEVNALVGRARAALDPGVLAPEGAAALDVLAQLLEMP
jgi:geranylgeranyl diphosphate synthase, type I